MKIFLTQTPSTYANNKNQGTLSITSLKPTKIYRNNKKVQLKVITTLSCILSSITQDLDTSDRLLDTGDPVSSNIKDFQLKKRPNRRSKDIVRLKRHKSNVQYFKKKNLHNAVCLSAACFLLHLYSNQKGSPLFPSIPKQVFPSSYFSRSDSYSFQHLLNADLRGCNC